MAKNCDCCGQPLVGANPNDRALEAIAKRWNIVAADVIIKILEEANLAIVDAGGNPTPGTRLAQYPPKKGWTDDTGPR